MPNSSIQDHPVINNTEKDLLEKNKKDLEQFFSFKNKKTQLTITLSAIALLLFMGTAATISFKNGVFQALYPKPTSYAAAPINYQTNKPAYLLLTSDETLKLKNPLSIKLSVFTEGQKANAFTTKINFDQDMLTATLIKPDLAFAKISSQKIDNQLGEINIAGTFNNPSENMSNQFITITFKAKETGNTTIYLEDPALFNQPEYTNLITENQDLEVEILP